MNVWAIADIHLSLSCPEKTMEDFGPRWALYMQRIQEHWLDLVQPEDLVLIPGDITWATHLDEALIDLNWIDKLKGHKLMIKGNHDSWWQSIQKLKKALPKSIEVIQNEAWNHKGLSIAGARLWDTTEYSCSSIVTLRPNPKANPKTHVPTPEENDRIYDKELLRLETSLKQMDQNANKKIVMTHYPPLPPDLQSTRAHKLMQSHQVDVCVFGHLHNVLDPHPPPFGVKDSIEYQFVAADYLHFKPKKIFEL